MDVVGGQGAWGVEDGQARGQAASSVLRWVILIRGLQEGPALLLWAPAVRRNNFLHRILFAFSRNPKRLSAEGVGDLNRLPSSRPGRQTWEGTFPQFQRPLQPPPGVLQQPGLHPYSQLHNQLHWLHGAGQEQERSLGAQSPRLNAQGDDQLCFPPGVPGSRPALSTLSSPLSSSLQKRDAA